MEQQFWADVTNEPNGCQHRQSGKVTNQVHLNGKVYGPWNLRTARRFAFASYYKRLPQKFVYTTCSDGACVNPLHMVDSNRPWCTYQQKVVTPTPPPTSTSAPAQPKAQPKAKPHNAEWLNDTGPQRKVEIPEVHDMPTARQVTCWLWAVAAVGLGTASTVWPLYDRWLLPLSLVCAVLALVFK